MNNILIIDDVVDKKTQDLIEKSIFSPETQWTFGRTVFYDNHLEVSDEQKNDEQKKTLMSFTKSLYRNDDNYTDKDLPLYIKPLEGKFSKLMTARIQLQLPTIPEQHKKYGVPHIDGYRPFPYKVAVYYVNDVDGPTILFKQTKHNTTPEDIKLGKVDIDSEVHPKKGRLVIFDGDIYHAVGKPKTDLRCIINYNFI
jgi:hypothetical protein